MCPRMTSDSDGGFAGDYCIGSVPRLKRLCIGEKIRYLEQQMSEIRAAKSAFAKKFCAMNQEIESMMRTIGACAEERERNLKALLQRIGQTQTFEWERQLELCRDAEQILNRFRQGTLADLQPTCNAYARSIGFIVGGQLELEGGVTSLLQQLDLFGQFFGGELVEADSEIIQPKLVIGAPGKNNGEFCRPWGVCADPAGRILVVDRGNNRVQVFSECGKFQFLFGESGSGPGQFDRPAGITVDRKLRIIVTDKDNHRVQVFTFNGNFSFAFGRKGTYPGLFQYPWGVAVDGDGNIAVSDTRNRRIQLFDDGGVFIAKCDFYKGFEGLSKRVSPRGLAFLSGGSLMVTDFNNGCVLLIGRDFQEVTKWKGGDQSMLRPQGIAYDGRGAVAVVDSKTSLVQVFDEDGNLVRFFGRKGTNPGEFDCLQDICFDISGNMVVTEFGNNRMQVL